MTYRAVAHGLDRQEAKLSTLLDGQDQLRCNVSSALDGMQITGKELLRFSSEKAAPSRLAKALTFGSIAVHV